MISMMSGCGNTFLPIFCSSREGIGIYIFNFDSDQVECFAKCQNLIVVCEFPIDKIVDQPFAGTIGVWVHYTNVQVEIDGRLNHHATQLTTAEYTYFNVWIERHEPQLLRRKCMDLDARTKVNGTPHFLIIPIFSMSLLALKLLQAPGVNL